MLKTKASEKSDVAESLAQKAREWVASPEGGEVIRKTIQAMAERVTQLQETQRVDQRILHEPVTR
jgi:hypothetical protein